MVNVFINLYLGLVINYIYNVNFQDKKKYKRDLKNFLVSLNLQT